MSQYTELIFIDYAIIGVYLAGVFILGSYFGKYVKDAGDFFVAGKALPFWAIGMSIVVTDIGAMDFVGVAGAAYNSGISVANFDWIGSMPAMVFAAFIFIPYYWRAGVYTIPEFLGRRYNEGVQLLHAGIWGVFLLVSLSLMLWVTADKFLNVVLGWNIYYGLWAMVLIAGIYTLSGGLSAVVMTDVVQLVVMFIGGFALLFMVLWETGGPAKMIEDIQNKPPRIAVIYDGLADGQVVTPDGVGEAFRSNQFDVLSVVEVMDHPAGIQQFLVRVNGEGEGAPVDDVPTKERINTAASAAAPAGFAGETSTNMSYYKNHFNILLPNTTQTAFPWTGIVFGLGIVMATAYMSGNQAIVQRTLGARSEWDAKGGMLFGGFLKAFIPLLVGVPGLAAVLIIPDLAEGDKAVPTLIKQLLPPGLSGLMFAALLAALMSSIDSTLSSASTIWTTDLYGRFRKYTAGVELGEKEALIVGRTFTATFIILAGLLAPVVGANEGVYNYIQTIMSLFQGPVFAILLLGIMWHRATRWGGLAGLVLGVCFTSILSNVDNLFPSEQPYLFVSWWSFVFSVIVTIIVSLFTKPEPEEKIRGLVFGQIMKDGEIQRVLGSRIQQ